MAVEKPLRAGLDMNVVCADGISPAAAHTSGVGAPDRPFPSPLPREWGKGVQKWGGAKERPGPGIPCLEGLSMDVRTEPLAEAYAAEWRRVTTEKSAPYEVWGGGAHIAHIRRTKCEMLRRICETKRSEKSPSAAA